MGLITEFLLNTLRQQLDRQHVVVWYDPRGEYRTMVAKLNPKDLDGSRPATLARYDPSRGYLALRHDLEPIWAADDPPRLLIYVAAPRAETLPERALIEYEAAGVVVQPGSTPAERDTSLAAVTRRALQGKRAAAEIERLAGQVGAGSAGAEPAQITLEELEAIVDKGQADGVLNLLYPEARHPYEFVLYFLAGDETDKKLIQRDAVGQMAGLLADTLGVSFTDAKPAALREAAARRVLLTDLALALGDAAPPILTLAEQPAARQAAADLAAEWRAREPLAAAYERWARAIDASANVAGRLNDPAPDWRALAGAHTFPAAETRLQVAVEEALLQKPTAELVELAAARRDGYWSRRSAETRGRWSAILSAGQLRLEAGRVLAGLRDKSLNAVSLWKAYTSGRPNDNRPWCMLDRYQRHFERDYHAIDIDERRHDALQRLAARTRQDYATATGALAERFVRAYEEAKFELPGQIMQGDIYQSFVYPASSTEPVAYILVDAFRYEMAQELAERLDGGRAVELTSAVATPPTITEVGMAALMPGAEKGVFLSDEKDRLKVIVAGTTLSNRQARIELFKKAAGEKSVVLKLDQLTPLTSDTLRKQISAAPLVMVTATEEIDGRCENAPGLARKELDSIFEELRRALGALFQRGIRTAVITADHGYIFGEALAQDQLMERPGGQAVVEKRRVWVGRGGQSIPGTLRAPLSAFGLAGDAGEPLELVTPYAIAAFKVPGGNLEYFHGGLTLPELVVPVLTVRAGPDDMPIEKGEINWTLQPGSKTISTQVATVTIEGRVSGLFEVSPPRVMAEVRVGGRSVSTLIGASDGFQSLTGDIQLKVDQDDRRQVVSTTAIMQITETPTEPTAIIVLLDATGVELARVADIPIAITI